MSETRAADPKTLSEQLPFEQVASDPLFYANASRDTDMPSLVSDALNAGRTQLAFQPVAVANKQKDITFYECLARIRDGEGRLLSAAQFMGDIEEAGLGRDIDAKSLDLALNELQRNPNMRLSVNVSARSLADGNWRRTLEAGLLSQSNLRDRLIFEIGENSAMQLHEVVIRFMREMRPRGIAFALDGFGAGFTSFRYLRDFFFDIVKIDKGFAHNIAQNPDNQVLAEALITVAKQFEMFVVADGIETAEDARFFELAGVDCLQGYFVGRPQSKL